LDLAGRVTARVAFGQWLLPYLPLPPALHPNLCAHTGSWYLMHRHGEARQLHAGNLCGEDKRVPCPHVHTRSYRLTALHGRIQPWLHRFFAAAQKHIQDYCAEWDQKDPVPWLCDIQFPLLSNGPGVKLPCPDQCDPTENQEPWQQARETRGPRQTCLPQSAEETNSGGHR